MTLSRKETRQLRRENQQWPEKLVELRREEWPAGFCAPGLAAPAKVMRSRDFLVQTIVENNTIRLMISRTERDPVTGRWKDGITWDQIQRLKTEAGYGPWFGIEVFPADSNVVNAENLRHVWLMPGEASFAALIGATNLTSVISNESLSSLKH